MVDAVKHTIEYFKAPANYFWQWADNGEVVEWKHGVTICYRDDLVQILQAFSNENPPSLGIILLILSACKRRIDVHDRLFLIRSINDVKRISYPDSEDIERLMKRAIDFLDVIAQLPVELRTGENRIHLFHEIFQSPNFIISNKNLHALVEELKTGNLDAELISPGRHVNWRDIQQDFLFIVNALEKFPDSKTLELELRTGLEKIPTPIEITQPETLPVDLWTALLEDPETAGMAKLSQRLIAALNIPMHVQGNSDLPLGGISDITNRGDYDRLLLSELAHDDELLAARLVNNEALYFRREEPPEKPKLQRTILVDTTIKMWGTSRVFAVAAALAVSQSKKHGESTESYALGGDIYAAINLSSKQGIIEALEKLDHALGCGNALEQIIKELPAENNNEYFFITDERLLASASFHLSLSKVKESLSYILTVQRNGELRFYQCINGRTKLLNTAKFDLEKSLFEKEVKAKTKSPAGEELPIFIGTSPSPLFFPEIRISTLSEKIAYFPKIGLLAVNETQRLLYIPNKDKAAIELLDYIEKGKYTLGKDADATFFVMVTNHQKKFLKYYKLSTTERIKEINLSDEIHYAKDIVFNDSYFYIRTDFASFKFNCATEKVVEQKARDAFENIFKKHIVKPLEDQAGLVGMLVNNNYSILFSIKSMYINSAGELVLGKHILKNLPSGHISFDTLCEENKDATISAKQAGEIYYPLRNKHIKFSRWIWNDGSEAIIDSKGFLHLKSSDTSLPEITIVLILGRTTSCWASDEVVCGSDYFLPLSISKVITTQVFYPTYIQKFIDRLR